jgi:hypothetical protein
MEEPKDELIAKARKKVRCVCDMKLCIYEILFAVLISTCLLQQMESCKMLPVQNHTAYGPDKFKVDQDLLKAELQNIHNLEKKSLDDKIEDTNDVD